MDPHDIYPYRFVKHNGEIYGVWDDYTNKTQLLPLSAVPEDIGDGTSLTHLTISVPHRQIERVEPVEGDPETVRALFRLDVMPWDLVREGKYPFSSATHRFDLTEDDLLCLIDRLPLFKNSFLHSAWTDSFQDHGDHDHINLTPLDEDHLLFSLLEDQFFDMMEWYDPEEDDWQFILPLRDLFIQNRNKAPWEVTIPKDFKNAYLDVIKRAADRGPISDNLRAYYAKLLEELLLEGDPDDIRIYAYAYYGGDGVVPCDWKKSEKALLRLFDPDVRTPKGDDYAANSLGYIYYSNRLGEPDLDKAFRCFYYAAKHGVVEATYKLSDMYRKGDGTPQNSEKAWELISKLWARRNRAGKTADIALRMGYCYRDGVGVEKDADQAMTFFKRAKKEINARLKRDPQFGDEVVARNIDTAIESLSITQH